MKNLEPLLKETEDKFYFVKDNETLNDVARNLNTTVMNILRQNDKIFLTQDQLIVYKEN